MLKKKTFSPAKLAGTSTGFWIDANDYAVGAIANGTTITNKFNSSENFTVTGTGLSVAVNARGRKAFVFDGTTVLTHTNKVYARFLHNIAPQTIIVIGKVGNSADPNAIYSLVGNNGTSSTNTGMYLGWDDRVAVSDGGVTRNNGILYSIARAVINLWVFNNYQKDCLLPNTPGSMVVTQIRHTEPLDNARLYTNRELKALWDRQRSTANSTSSVGAPYGALTTDATYNLEIGGGGNGVVKLIGEIEQVVITNTVISEEELNLVASHYNVPQSTTPKNFISPVTLQTINNSAYVLGCLLAEHPTTKNTIFLSSSGANHFGANTDREGIMSKSTDKANFSAYQTIWQDPDLAIHSNISGGYTDTGKLVAMYGEYDHTPSVQYMNLRVRTSEDEGVTFTNATITPPAGITSYVAMDQICKCGNGDYVIPYYGLGTNLYEIWVARSTNNGATWTTGNRVFTSTTEYINEPSVVSLGGNFLLLAARKETTVATFFGYNFYLSSDNGLTWASQGFSNLGDNNTVYAHPPMLRVIYINSLRVLALYWTNRNTRRAKVMYLKGTDAHLPANYNKRIYTIDVDVNSSYVSGYPYILHPAGTLDGYGVYFNELSSSNTEAKFIRLPTSHQAQIITDLGL